MHVYYQVDDIDTKSHFQYANIQRNECLSTWDIWKQDFSSDILNINEWIKKIRWVQTNITRTFSFMVKCMSKYVYEKNSLSYF
jgi:hypothetical protein